MLGQHTFLFAVFCLGLVFNHTCNPVFSKAQGVCGIPAAGFLIVLKNCSGERHLHYKVAFFSVDMPDSDRASKYC